MAPNAAEESEKHDEEVCGHPLEDEDEIDGVRGEYGTHRGYDDRGNFVVRGDFGNREDYELRKGERVKRSNSGQRGDLDQRRESTPNEDYGRGEYGFMKADHVMRRRKFSDPRYPTLPRVTSSGPQDLDDNEFPYGRLRGNYRQGRFDYDGKERRYDYGSDFDRYGYRGEGSFYDADHYYGRAPFARRMGRFTLDEPYGDGGSYGRERKSFAYGRDSHKPEYNSMYYGRYGNDTDYNMANGYKRDSFRFRDQDKHLDYFRRPSRFGWGYVRDNSRSRDEYSPRRNYYGMNNYEVGPYRRNYDLEDRDFFVDRYEVDRKSPIQTGYGAGRGSDIYSPSGRYGFEPSSGLYLKYHSEMPHYSRNSLKSRYDDFGFEDDHYIPFERRPYLNANLYWQSGRRAYGDDIMDGYGMEKAMPRRGYHSYRIGSSRRQEPSINRRMSDGHSRVQFASDHPTA